MPAAWTSRLYRKSPSVLLYCWQRGYYWDTDHFTGAHQDACRTFKTNKMRLFFLQYLLKQWTLLLQGAVEAKRLQKFRKGLKFMGEKNNPSRTLRWKDTISGWENPWDTNCWRLEAYTGEVLLPICSFLSFFPRHLVLASVLLLGTAPSHLWQRCETPHSLPWEAGSV